LVLSQERRRDFFSQIYSSNSLGRSGIARGETSANEEGSAEFTVGSRDCAGRGKMPAHRKAIEVIIATGADKVQPGRYKDRANFSPEELGELGKPPKTATERIRKLWAEFAKEFPWLRASDRAAIFALCVVRARIGDEPEKCDAKLVKHYIEGLKAIGGTPGTRTRMPRDWKADDGEDSDEDGDSYVA
jgi:hypothetical protein